MSRRPDETREPSARDPSTTRRRSLFALGAAMLGAAGYGYGVAPSSDRSSDADVTEREHTTTPARLATLTALADAVYPPGIDVDREFIERRVFGRTEPKPGHFEGVVAAVDAVNGRARARFGAPITEISVDDRRRVLRSMGATVVHPNPDGTVPERVRHYLVNDLLFALFTSPASSGLTGIENPPGHPGGRDAYQRGPDES
ncbi:gluconate 2-dehydrogenase subunit 3 family protein [Halorubrum sp. DTA46]|uniref:gluconate 2-dehydrogenase subunit 3 family protein n=1 Tax=Halorubrum sp. DTA46 TaxID=3402162 RepID=UPI003AAC52C9